jgi:hypothetical protein
VKKVVKEAVPLLFAGSDILTGNWYKALPTLLLLLLLLLVVVADVS